MRNTKVGLGLVFVLLMSLLVGCGPVVDNPYESCVAGDSCSNGTVCTQATLSSSSYVGSFCTNGCNTDSDCVVDLTNYSPVCVVAGSNPGLCYIQCPSSATCPYGTSCASVQDALSGATIQVCVP